MVRSYTSKQLLDKVKTLKSFVVIPSGYWILGVQSNEDAYDRFDDKFYLFKGEDFIMVTTGTTNAGSDGQQNFEKYNAKGVAVLPTNTWFYDIWSFGLHQGKMQALKQVKPITLFRDNIKNKKIDEVQQQTAALVGINFHTVSYTKKAGSGYIGSTIGSWSVGCQVANNIDQYYQLLNLVKNQKTVSYCLIKEFNPN
jgi:hypothetical protein